MSVKFLEAAQVLPPPPRLCQPYNDRDACMEWADLHVTMSEECVRQSSILAGCGLRSSGRSLSAYGVLGKGRAYSPCWGGVKCWADDLRLNIHVSTSVFLLWAGGVNQALMQVTGVCFLAFVGKIPLRIRPETDKCLIKRGSSGTETPSWSV